MKEKIIEIIVKVSEDETIRTNENIDLLESGILDSLAFINLIIELENEFNIDIELTQIDENVWRSVDQIAKQIALLK